MASAFRLAASRAKLWDRLSQSDGECTKEKLLGPHLCVVSSLFDNVVFEVETVVCLLGIAKSAFWAWHCYVASTLWLDFLP